jgi:hypothetical protein
LGQLSSEKKRSKVTNKPSVEEKKVTEVIKKVVEDSDDMQVIQKKKGVGYTTDLG